MTAEDGTAGIGEGWSEQSAIGAFFAHLRQHSTALLGRSADAIGEVHATLSALSSDPAWAAPAVASAVDMALWDMRARREGVPLFAALGGADGEVPVYASGGLYGTGKDASRLAAEMRGYADRGFTAVKMKIAGLPLAADLARVAAVREAIGDRAIIVDAVERLTPASAPAWLDALAALGVWAIQAPLPARDLEGMAKLQARGPLVVVAQEREHRPDAFRALLGQRAVGMLQFCPGLAGGFTGGLALIELAREAGVPVTLQCYSTAVMQSACFHLAAGRPGVHSAEFHQFHDNLYDALPPAMTEIRCGRLQLGDAPGLGLDPRRVAGALRPVFVLP